MFVPPGRVGVDDLEGSGWRRWRLDRRTGSYFTLAESEVPDAFASNDDPTFEFYTTGNVEVFARVASRLLRIPVTNAEHVDL